MLVVAQASEISPNPTIISGVIVETPEQRTHRFIRVVTTVTLALVITLIILMVTLSVLVSWKSWVLSAIGATIYLVPSLFSWWLARKNNYQRVAALINVSCLLIIILVLYWLSPATGIYFVFVFLLTMVRLILGRIETLVVFAIIFCTTLFYGVFNNNDFYSPTGQLVKLDYGTFALWWLMIACIVWLTSFLYNTVQRDNQTLNLQAFSLRQALEELQQKQAASQTESNRVLELGVELNSIAKQQLAESHQQVSSVTQVAGFVEEMAYAADSIKEQTFQVQDSAVRIASLAETIQSTFAEVLVEGRVGEEAASRTIAANQQVESEYIQLREHLAELATFQSQLRNIVEIIRAISNETHLLSLNAAIEAAGAGIYGERFAVVAGEVKNLAKRAQHSSTQVTQILSKVDNGINQVVQAADNSQIQVKVALDATQECGTVMGNIVASINRNVKQVAEISTAVSQIRKQSSQVSTATSQQSSASNQAATNLTEIKTIAARSFEVSDLLSQSAGSLTQVSANLVKSLN